MKEENEKAGLNLTFKKTKIMASSPITLANRWRKTGNRGRFYFLGLQNHCSDCNHEIKRHLPLGRKAMTNVDSVLKGRDITLVTKVHTVNALVVPVAMYKCESWMIKKAECQRIDAFEL